MSNSYLYHIINGEEVRFGRTVPGGGGGGGGTGGVRPSGPDYVRYEDLYVSGNTFRDVVHKVTNLKILTLPEGTFTYSDFRDPQGFYDSVRVPKTCRGIVGSGPNTILSLNPFTSTVGSDTRAVPTANGQPNQCNAIQVDQVNNVEFGNFTMLGSDQGHPWNGLKVSNATGVNVHDIFFSGASYGTSHQPPGETTSLAIYACTNASIYRCEVDCRDPNTGTRVASSPVSWASCTNAYMEDCYAHHSIAGMVTFYKVAGVHTLRLRSEYNGSGSGLLSGASINHEDCTGAILHESPTMIIDRAGGNTGLHTNLSSGNIDNTNISFTSITHDAGPGTSGCFSVNMSAGYKDPAGNTQKQVTPPHVTKNGVTLTSISSKTNTAGANTNVNFISYY